MPLDASAVRCTAYEINNLLKGGRIEKIYQPERDEIVLLIKAPSGSHRLVISANSQNPRLYVTKQIKENPQEPPMFCMLLRKHITSGRIFSVTSVDFERIIDIKIEAHNEMGDTVEKHIICEIMGKNSNVILTDENNKILDSIKHVDLTVSRVRNIFPGLTYHLPPDGERLNPLCATKGDFYNILIEAGEGKNVDKALTGAVSGISPLMAREAMYRAIKRSDCVIGELSDNDKEKIALSLSDMFEKIKNYEFDCVVLYKKNEKKPCDFAVYEVKQYEDEYVVENAEGICEALERFYSERDSAERMRSRSFALLKNVSGQLERVRKKITLLHQTLTEAEGKEKFRIAGDIITANLYRMKQGDESLVAVNYYDENSGEITIELDGALSPSKNAQRYYKKYQKAKTAEVEAAKQLVKANDEMEYLESVVNEIESAKTPSELDEIKEELLMTGVIRNTQTKKKAAKKIKMSPPEEYLYEGYTIYSGKNNIQNDYLTLKIGRATDLWLHTKNIPGSHVLVKSRGEAIPNKVIEAACIIAATNSKGNKSSKVEVDYCPVSHVKKPNGAKAGMVIYEEYNTAVVTPDEEFCLELKNNVTKEKNIIKH